MPTKFQLRSQDGTVYSAVEIESRIRSTNMDSTGHEFMPGLPTFRLTDGTPLKLRQDGAFELSSGKVLRRR